MSANLYETDFYAWTTRQAELLRSGRLSDADIENIAEEIESMGKGERRELESRLSVLLLHLLKWRFQSALRGNSRRLSDEEQRRKLARHIKQNPSLKALLGDAVADAYGDALIDAERETGLPRSTFPTECPWSFDTIMDAEFWPG